MSNNYGEILCQATEILAQHLIDKVAYDSTILCTIVNDDEKELGKYRVQNSEAIFDAYTSDTSFKKGNQVYVSIPMGNWNEQKLIVAKKMDNINQPIAYKDPFDSFVNITNNLIGSDLKSQGLIANDSIKKQILLWSYNKDDSDALIKNNGDVFNGYTRLALSADFQSWLKELGIVAGDYGLNLIIEIEPEDSEDIKEDGNQVSSSIKVCSLNCLDMIGNPYNYESFYNQKKIFDISGLKNIKSMELWFYQKEGSFLNHERKAVTPHKAPNIFVKNIAISLGYDTESFENDTLIIYTMDSIKYDGEKVPFESNHKQLFTRWIHKFEDGSVKAVNLEDNIDYNLTWYRYEQGARSHTAYSGVDWNPLATQVIAEKQATYTIIDKDWKTYNTQSLNGADTPTRNMAYNQAWLLPDTNRAEEKIKAIIQYNGNETDGYGSIVESAQLIFSNVTEVVNKATVDAIQALSINCEDDSFGNYLIYNLGGQIIDNAEAQKVREFKAYFNSAADDIEDDQMAELTEASSIEWIIPSQNTMIDVEDFISADYYEKDGYYHIFRFGEKLDGTAKFEDDGIDGSIRHQNSQRYRIKSHYTNNYSNNTIKCVITKNKIKYTAVKELTFGPAGTSGTDYTFVLDFNNGITALTIGSNEKIIVKARLYDYSGKEIPNLKVRDIQWSLDEKENTHQNDYIKIIPQTNKDEIEVQLLNTVKSIPEDNYTILRATLKSAREYEKADEPDGWGDYDLLAYLPLPIRISKDYQSISGTTTIVYNGLGYLDNYFQNPYCLNYIDYNIINYQLAYNNYYYTKKDDINFNQRVLKVNEIAKIIIQKNNYKQEEHYVKDVNNVYVFKDNVLNDKIQVIDGSWTIHSGQDEPNKEDPYKPNLQKNSNNQWYIKPINIYVENSMKELCIVGSIKEKNGKKINVWSQPLFVIQNKYPSSIINKWNGELTIDNANNAILAAKIVAGKKNNDNTFSGVMMGDWSGKEVVYETVKDPNNPAKEITQPKKNATGATEIAIAQHTGIYGFQKGIASFGFRDDGTAFIGKPGAGRLEFNGDKSQIISNRMENNLGGMILDFDDGLIKMINPNNAAEEGTILLDATAKETPFTIGVNGEENFKVNWDGSIEAHNGKFYGHLEGDTGHIGGWTLDEVGNLYSDNEATILYRNGKIHAKYIETNSGDIGGWKINSWGLSSENGEFYLASYGMLSMGNGKYPTVIDSSGMYTQQITIYDSIKVGGSINEDGTVNRPTTTVSDIQGYLGAVASGMLKGPNGELDKAAGVGLMSKNKITAVKVLDTHVGMAYVNGGSTSIGPTTSSIYGKNYLNLKSNDTNGKVTISGNKLECKVPKENQTGIYARFA